jgi:Ca2+-binding EF-hand superfamily protein
MSEHTSCDDEICRVFKTLDTDNLGTLDLKEISRSTKAKVFMQLNKKDARIDLEEIRNGSFSREMILKSCLRALMQIRAGLFL